MNNERAIFRGVAINASETDYASDASELVDVLLVPDGSVRSDKKNFTLGEAEFKAIVAKFNKRGIDIVIDYEHQTLGGEHASPDGKAPAAGWVTELRYEKGRGIIGKVRWTDKARAMIRSGEYRYLSPVLMIRAEKSGNYPYELLHAAITNDPAIHNMERLVASRTKETIMPKKGTKKSKVDFFKDLKVLFAEHAEATPEEQAAVVEDVVEQVDEVGVALANLKSALGMGEGATPVEIINEAIERITAPEEGGDEGEGGGETEEAAASRKAMATVCSALSLKNGASAKDITGKIDRLVANRVSSKEYNALADRVKVFEDEQLEVKATAAVERFVASGQLNPQDKDKMQWANDRARSDPTAFTELMEGAPTVIPTGKIGEPSKGSGERERVIAKASTLFDGKSVPFPDLPKWSFVNQALRDNEFDTLNKTERTKLGEEV